MKSISGQSKNRFGSEKGNAENKDQSKSCVSRTQNVLNFKYRISIGP